MFNNRHRFHILLHLWLGFFNNKHTDGLLFALDVNNLIQAKAVSIEHGNAYPSFLTNRKNSKIP